MPATSVYSPNTECGLSSIAPARCILLAQSLAPPQRSAAMSCWSPCNDGIAAEQACESPDGLVPHVAPGAHFGPPREPRRSVTGKASAPGNRSARSTAERGLAPAERTPFPVNRGRQGSGPGEVDPISTHWTMARRRHRAECGIPLPCVGESPTAMATRLPAPGFRTAQPSGRQRLVREHHVVLRLGTRARELQRMGRRADGDGPKARPIVRNTLVNHDIS